MSVRAFQLHRDDSVATLLDDAPAGATIVLLGTGRNDPPLVTREPIQRAHKIAVVPVAADAPVLKFGVPIGRATTAIAPGAWVHLHNLASNHDERSASLDLQTGAPSDTDSAYV